MQMAQSLTLRLSVRHRMASPGDVWLPDPTSSLSILPSHRWRSSWEEVQRLEASRACSSLCRTSALPRLSTEYLMPRLSAFSWTSRDSSTRDTQRCQRTPELAAIHHVIAQFWQLGEECTLYSTGSEIRAHLI